MSYLCEKSVGAARSCDFRSGKIILQQPIDRAQMVKLLAGGKTDLLPKFISKKGRPFGAYLVAKEGKVSFEFEPRKARGKAGATAAKTKEPAVKLDFAGQESLGSCPKCGGKVFETEKDFVCEKSQADTKACKFRIGKLIAQRPMTRTEAGELLASGKTGLLEQFVSKTGRPFSAYLLVDDSGKVTFDFPPREN